MISGPATIQIRMLQSSDPINHPSHYNAGRIEAIEFIEDQKLGFHLASALKYIVRAGKKDPGTMSQDLSKAIWYIRRHQELLKPEAARRRPNAMPLEAT